MKDFGNAGFNGCPKPPAGEKRRVSLEKKAKAQSNKVFKPPLLCRKCVWRRECGKYFGYEKITGGVGCGIFKRVEGVRK